MVHTCCIQNCKERQKRNQNLSFHRFPRNPQIREKWIKAIKCENFEVTVYSRVCSKHFGSNCFIGNSPAFKRLRCDAIPCISEVPEVSHIQPIEVVYVPCIKIENESESEIVDEDDSFDSVACTDEVIE